MEERKIIRKTIKKISIVENRDVYDITTEKNHNFFANKTLVHNCGEIPLPANGVCCLGMLILPTFVKNPFVSQEIDIDSLKKTVRELVFMLDTVLDVSKYPLRQNEKTALQDRRIGVGITGLADMLTMLKIKYDSDEAVYFVDVMMQTIRNAAYEASIELAKLKGPFPKFDSEKFLKGKFIQTLPENMREEIKSFGIRNVSLLTCQPAGTVSLLLNNVSSGIEPIFSLKQKRTMRDEDGGLTRKVDLLNYAYKYYTALGFKSVHGEKPDFFQTTKDVSLKGHLKMQNKIQQYVDNSISKTINFPKETSYEEFKDFIYDILTNDYYIKGITTFREGTIASILTDADHRPEKKPEDSYRKNSFSYQIKRTSGDPSAHVHITHSDGIVSQVFIASKDMDFYKQTLPYTRLLSIIFEREKDPAYILQILQELEDFDFITEDEKYIYKDKKYNHFLAALKEVIWDTMEQIGLIRTEDESEPDEREEPPTQVTQSKMTCHECGGELRKESKCWMCSSCGVSSGSCEF